MRYIFYVVTLFLSVVFMAAATATGGAPTPAATPGITGSATAQGDMRSYGFGGTGLTSTAPCLESISVAFGLAAFTQVNKGCVLRLYAEQCKDEACRQKMRCADPDLMDEGKEALGCPQPKP